MAVRTHEVGAAALALLFYAVHGAAAVARGAPEDALWQCHVACLLIAGGLLAPSAAACLAGVQWLALGVPLWLLDLATGGELHETSILTHVGGLAVGLWGARRLGARRGVWWRSLLLLVALLIVTRLATPARANVNLAFAVWPGWEPLFPSHAAYLAMLGLLAAVAFRIAEELLARTLS